MKVFKSLIFTAATVLTLSSGAVAQDLEATQLTDNEYDDQLPMINNADQVVWQGWDGTDWEIFLHGESGTVQITDNAEDDGAAQINDSGTVVWQGFDGDSEIFLYDGTSPTNISNNDLEDSLPQINNQGHVVWIGSDGMTTEVFLFDGSTVASIHVCTMPMDPMNIPRINDHGHVVWSDLDASMMPAVFLYDGSTATNISGTSGPAMLPVLNNNGQVAWVTQDFQYGMVVELYDGQEIERLYEYTDLSPQLAFAEINDNGYVAMSISASHLWGVMLYDGVETSGLVGDGNIDMFPKVNNHNHVVWQGGTGGTSIYYYDGTETVQMTSGTPSCSEAQINDKGSMVWICGDGTTNEIFFVQGTMTPPPPPPPPPPVWGPASVMNQETQEHSNVLNSLVFLLVPLAVVTFRRVGVGRRG